MFIQVANWRHEEQAYYTTNQRPNKITKQRKYDMTCCNQQQAGYQCPKYESRNCTCIAHAITLLPNIEASFNNIATSTNIGQHICNKILPSFENYTPVPGIVGYMLCMLTNSNDKNGSFHYEWVTRRASCKRWITIALIVTFPHNPIKCRAIRSRFITTAISPLSSWLCGGQITL